MESERSGRVAELMRREGLDALVCRLPQNVVMLTGYLPIIGDSFCVVSLGADGQPEARLAVPGSDTDLLRPGMAKQVKTFEVETMQWIGTALEGVHQPLAGLLADAHLRSGAVIGYEGGHAPVAVAYTQVGIPGPATLDLLRALVDHAQFRDATPVLDELAAVKTANELDGIRRSERAAVAGFEAARDAVHVGATEADVSAATYSALLSAGYAEEGAWHVLPFVHVMAGPRAYNAFKAYNLTSNYRIARGDTVTVQMEVGINGYWAELTRTFWAADISDEWRSAHEACVHAQDAALATIRAGINGSEADGAARRVMEQAGFGKDFKHGLGHGFGLQAINHGAMPVLHPASHQILRAGMVHNMEPAVYLEGKGGLRLNDNVAVRDDGNELLSSRLPRDLDWLVTKK